LCLNVRESPHDQILVPAPAKPAPLNLNLSLFLNPQLLHGERLGKGKVKVKVKGAADSSASTVS
jgi:hypothetical protein